MFGDRVQEPNVSMIITDYWMPEMTGYELLKKVKVRASLFLLLQVLPSGNLSFFRAKSHLVYEAKIAQESSTLKQIPVVIMSSENVPTRISRSEFYHTMFKYYYSSMGIRRRLTPVPFLSMLIRCLEEGAEDFLMKPVRPSDVSRVFNRVLP